MKDLIDGIAMLALVIAIAGAGLTGLAWFSDGPLARLDAWLTRRRQRETTYSDWGWDMSDDALREVQDRAAIDARKNGR